ncbi:ATP-binding protein [Runella slithyformis]|uniref:AAA ATPase n=1 Tax=Runella slithyformis (strain ATCC 29530 / DSM 19594 / LMG 11500 / NCIMB 11436 / LSU 4) TaxID=761193 RepID=A0A7U3ZGT8_RUNSL|nr:ATP-binding protein [Runella slithyformis]AEI46966.1 AAA ATPase [Runella slithyformis DSM 19594]
MVIQRRIEEEFRKKLVAGKVNLLVGARRVGKTFLLKKIIQSIDEPYLWLNGDDESTHTLLAERSLQNYKRLTSGISILIIDEAQMIQDIGLKLKIIVDEFPHLKIIASGSSAYALSYKVGEPLVGRAHWHRLYPIAQTELQHYENYLETIRNLEERLIYGSYPEIFQIENFIEKERYIKEILDSYLFKDLLTFDEIRNSNKIRNLLKLIAFQIGKEISYEELGKQLGMSKNTVEKYLDLLSKVFVVYRVGGYSKNLRKEVSKSSRWYFYDNGVRNALIDNFNPISLRNDIGELWENYLMTERLKKNEYERKYKEIYFWRTYDQQEIDCIEVKNLELEAYEFKWGNRNVKVPKAFAEAYPEAKFEVITKENYLDFIQ